MKRFVRIAVLFTFTLAVVGGSAFAAKVADIRNTKHNLSNTSPGTVKATTETQVCVFCHTPHAATPIKAPIWNRALSTSDGSYGLYTSESLQAADPATPLADRPAQPADSSKLCLSCHDGVMALGNVGVLNGLVNQTIALGGTDVGGTMPNGSGATTGYTRDLGTVLTNDHPISFTYNSALATLDAELVNPGIAPGNTYIANRVQHNPARPDLPLESGKMQCVTCHDPHIRDADLAVNAKFLRLNRLQEAAPGATFAAAGDQVCLGCHSKAGWSGSAHVNSAVADETYAAAAATQREFAANLPVWKAGCLNCHDTHTVQGARRLLREGTDSVATPKAGGNPAQEETCYQCHDGSTTVITPATAVPNIKTDFGLARHMPIKSTEQPAGAEVHAITDKDFSETQLLLGKGNLTNRHAECTDCHNPHRVIKNRLFNANPATPDAGGTHTHTLAAGQTHNNLASGVLAGTTGVEPVYVATAWGSLPSSYTLKKGNGGPGASTAVGSTWVTREYQVCLKCHSDYAWNEPNRPIVGPSIGVNGVTMYTNQAMEFQAPVGDKGEKVAGSVGALANHRSWHPVIDNTGRTAAVRGMNANLFLAPWNDATGTNIGNQTMYCSDCHGTNVTSGTSVIPDGGNPWGPHGSGNDFILKGTWNNETGAAGTNTSGLCFKCHDWNNYANPNNLAPLLSGFRQGVAAAGCALQNPTINLHTGHANQLLALECTWCHVAVPHGWKNKQLLIDISVAAPDGCGAVENCNAPPYIQGGYLGGNGAVNWRVSGEWAAADCGGQAWMNGMAAGGACNAPI
ncbi:MAG: hypothetical protein QG662_1556 [Pseudomonadota bacterium]|nr:hypothetical protein [Pseudomonadota bacterium]